MKFNSFSKTHSKQFVDLRFVFVRKQEMYWAFNSRSQRNQNICSGTCHLACVANKLMA